MQDNITLIGNIGTDPQLKSTVKGHVVNFRLATSSRRLNRTSGHWEDVEPNWYDISAWNELAEHATSSFIKGNRIIVVGKLRMRSYESNGVQRTRYEVVADALGHDLSLGSAVFTRRQRPQQAAEPSPGFAAPLNGAAATGQEHPADADAPPEDDAPESGAQWSDPARSLSAAGMVEAPPF